MHPFWIKRARTFRFLFCLQQTFLQYGPPALERGYAFASFDGPGQGSVIRFPPKMPFSPNMDQVLASVLDVITAAPFAQYIETDTIVVSGEMLAQACKLQHMSSPLQLCRKQASGSHL